MHPRRLFCSVLSLLGLDHDLEAYETSKDHLLTVESSAKLSLLNKTISLCALQRTASTTQCTAFKTTTNQMVGGSRWDEKSAQSRLSLSQHYHILPLSLREHRHLILPPTLMALRWHLTLCLEEYFKTHSLEKILHGRIVVDSTTIWTNTIVG